MLEKKVGRRELKAVGDDAFGIEEMGRKERYTESGKKSISRKGGQKSL